MRQHWNLAEGAAFLNHGSFGMCPRVVLEEQSRIRARMEAQPDRFFRDEVMPSDKSTLRAAAAALAELVDTSSENLAFVENASVGVQCVLRSMSFAPGDEILITSHTYNAVRLMVDARCLETGAVPRVAQIPVPATAEGIFDAIREAITANTRLAILDHITSPTAIVVPIERLIPELRKLGARIAIDGAHGVGQVPLSMRTLQPDWYVSNAHKWLFAPRGCAFLYASADVAPITQPPVTSHFVDKGFPWSFDWIGTRDYSPWLAIPAAIRFWKSLEPAKVRAHQRMLLEHGSGLLVELGLQPVVPLELCAAMRSFILPRNGSRDDAAAIMADYWARERIQLMSTALGERLLMRISAHVYVTVDDLDRLASAVPRIGWSGGPAGP